MIYLIFAILFSASLALALRISETFSDNRYGILVGNYVTCLVVAFILLPDKNILAANSGASFVGFGSHIPRVCFCLAGFTKSRISSALTKKREAVIMNFEF